LLQVCVDKKIARIHCIRTKIKGAFLNLILKSQHRLTYKEDTELTTSVQCGDPFKRRDFDLLTYAASSLKDVSRHNFWR